MLSQGSVRLLALVLGCAGLAFTRSSASAQAADSAFVRRLRTHVEFLASDDLGGRFASSPQARVAARYLAGVLQAHGYRGGAADGTFLQPVPLDSFRIDTSGSKLLVGRGSEFRALAIGRDYMVEEPGSIAPLVEAGLTFIGYGISAPRLGHDDFAAVDVRGRYVIAVRGAPAALADQKLEAGETGMAAIRRHGGRGLVIISEGLLNGYPSFSHGYTTRRRFTTRGRFRLRGDPPAPDLPVIQAGPALVSALAELLQTPESLLITPRGRVLPAPGRRVRCGWRRV